MILMRRDLSSSSQRAEKLRPLMASRLGISDERSTSTSVLGNPAVDFADDRCGLCGRRADSNADSLG
jgi:hypothetical protein